MKTSKHKILMDAKKEILHSAKIWLYASKYVKNNSFNKNWAKTIKL